MIRFSSLIAVFCLLSLISCEKDEEEMIGNSSDEVGMSFVFRFDDQQVRLGNLGQESEVAEGNAAQNPEFEKISAHYIELCPSATTALGQGEILYEAPETNAGGDQAIDFAQSSVVAEGDVFFQTNLSNVAPGEYSYLRVSLAFQQFKIGYLFNNLDLEGSLAGFIGYNTYIEEFEINNDSFSVFENKLQGYWAFETLGNVVEGQAPEGATTVVNPISGTSPVPPGSCVVTGHFDPPLIITGEENEDVSVLVSLSTNQSFEWEEVNVDGKFEPSAGETVVDMGIRGMIPSFE